MPRKIFFGIVIFFISVSYAYPQEYQVVRGIVDLHSNISDGLYPLEKIAKLAKEKGIRVLIFADSALRKWEYGLWPFRNLIKKTSRENSVLRFGIKRYLEKIDALRKESEDLLIIAGLEVSPFYYWRGNPLSKNFSLNDYYKQFLIFGLNQKDYQNIPILGNRQFFHISKKGLFGLWPIVMIILGLGLLRKKKIRPLEYRELIFIQPLRAYKLLGFLFIGIGVLFLINNLPFPTSNFNPYQDKQEIKPYQDVIDYVNQRDGLVFWAHPEMESLQRYKGVEVYTPAHPEDLFLAKDYTGFGITFTDRLKMTEAGGIWDKLLLEYLEGKRRKPVWIIGSLHYDGPARTINAVETDFFLKELTQRELLNALREGRMYVRFNLGKEPIILDEFSAKNIKTDAVQIVIKGKQVVSSQASTRFEIIRNGQSFKTLSESSEEFTLVENDDLSAVGGKAYYRLKISSPESIILSNPIFVRSETSDKYSDR